MPTLIDLLSDLHEPVAIAAACALGRARRIEARPMLKLLLQAEPTEEIIDAVASVADEDCIVLLRRIARSKSGLTAAAIDTLESINS
jgi:hypothetical protein